MNYDVRRFSGEPAGAMSRSKKRREAPHAAYPLQRLMNRGAGAGIALVLGLAGCAPRPDASPEGVRVVSLAPSVTEIVFAIGAGDLLVGRTDACDYPPEAERVPVVGSFGRPSMERVLTSGATLVLDIDLEDATARAEFRRRGLAAERITCDRLDDIPSAIRDIGRRTGRGPAANALADRIASDLADRRARAARHAESDRPRVFVELWPDPLMTVGRRSFVSDLLELAGGQNIAGSEARDYFTVDPEWVVARDPQVMLLLHASSEAIARRAVSGRTGWGGMEAVRTGRILAGFDPAIMHRPGPRVIEGVDVLHRALFGGEDGR